MNRVVMKRNSEKKKKKILGDRGYQNAFIQKNLPKRNKQVKDIKWKQNRTKRNKTKQKRRKIILTCYLRMDCRSFVE